MIYLSYRDADGETGYRRETVAPGTQMLREQVFPGAFGFPDLHVTHISGVLPSGNTLFVIATTSRSIDGADRLGILYGAARFLEENP